MATRKLTKNVYGSDGVLYGPDGEQKVPASISEELTNDKLYADSPSSDEVPADYPEGDPSKDWTAKQLSAWAEAHVVDLGDATSKGDIVAKLGLTD